MKKYSDNFIANYMINDATHNGASEIMVYGNRRVTWAALNERTNRIAQALIEKGVRKDDKVILMFHNCPEFLEVNYAIQKCGAIPVPMNYRFTAPEITYQADNSDAVVFVFEDIWLDAVQKARPNLKKVREFICSGPECPSDMTPYSQIMKEYAPREPDVPTGEDDVCVICYTGGTTGFPKGVMLTYGAHLKMYEEFIVNMLLRIAYVSLSPLQRQRIKERANMPMMGMMLAVQGTQAFKWLMSKDATARFLHRIVGGLLRDVKRLRRGFKNNNKVMFPSFPLFHDASYQLGMMAPIVGNMTILATEGVKMDPGNVLAMIEKEQPTLMANVPTGWKMLVEYPDIGKFNTSSLTALASGAGLCHVDLKKEIMDRFPGTIFVDLFGQTEMTPITSFRLDSSPENITDRSVGKPMVDTRIVDEEGRDVPPGQVGEIIYRSPTIMKGYYKDEQKTAQVIRNGWFYSGDLGLLDENGEIRVVERKNECINTGGEKVFPLEVEQVIAEHPAVKHVCIIGVPDEKWGNNIRAVVQLKEGEKAYEKDIIAACENKLAGYKRPRSVVFVSEFPLSPVGKVLRNKVREHYGKP